MLNAFDRVCAVLAFLVALVFLVLGVLGLFTGCRAHFSLPPVLGVLPALVGWGIVRSVYVAWNASNRWPGPEPYTPPPVRPPYLGPEDESSSGDEGYFRPGEPGR